MRKILALVLSVALVAGIVSISPVSGSTATLFTDISNHWAKDGILHAAEKGYVSGYPDGTFKPNNGVTRAEFIKMIVDDLGLSHGVDTKVWYQPYVDAAVESGVHSEKDFNSEYAKPITRLEMSRVITRALIRDKEYKAYYDSFKGLYNGDLPFVDYRDIKQEDVPYLALVFGAKIISGYPDLSFGMGKKATRAEAAVMLNNFDKANVVSPVTFQYLNELKEIAETGTNAESVSNLIRKANIKTDNMLLEHWNYNATLKRLYIIPIEGNIISMYERKYLGDRTLLEDRYLEGIQGYAMGVADVTFKKSGSRSLYTSSLFMSPSGGAFAVQEPHKKFGFVFPMMQENYDLVKDKTEEIVLYGYYTREDHNVYFVSNNAYGINNTGIMLLNNLDTK